MMSARFPALSDSDDGAGGLIRQIRELSAPATCECVSVKTQPLVQRKIRFIAENEIKIDFSAASGTYWPCDPPPGGNETLLPEINPRIKTMIPCTGSFFICAI